MCPIQSMTFQLPTPPNYDGTPYVAIEKFAPPFQSNGHLSNGQTVNGASNGSDHGLNSKSGNTSQNANMTGKTNLSLYKGVGPHGKYGAVNLADAQQYARPMGFVPLLDALRKLTLLLHKPPYDFQQLPTSGNTDACTKIFRALLDTDDTLLVEDFGFAPPIAAARALGAGIRGVPMDILGIVPEQLDEMLINWNVDARGKK